MSCVAGAGSFFEPKSLLRELDPGRRRVMGRVSVRSTGEIEDEVLAGCQAGDISAFAQLVEAYRDRVFRLCFTLVGQDADDVAQETFLRVHRGLRRFSPHRGARLSTWILCIARNLCRDHHRRQRTRERATLAALKASHVVPTTPEEHAVSTSTEDRLLHALASLPEEQRVAIALWCWDELEYAEIAAIEGVPVGTIRSRLARARDALATALASDLDKESEIAGVGR